MRRLLLVALLFLTGCDDIRPATIEACAKASEPLGGMVRVSRDECQCKGKL